VGDSRLDDKESVDENRIPFRRAAASRCRSPESASPVSVSPQQSPSAGVRWPAALPPGGALPAR